MSNLRAYLLVTCLNLAALGAGAYALRDPRSAAVRIEPPPTATPAPTPAIQVYVSGAVRRPAVVRLAPDARAADALAAAGGFSGAADRAAVNLAAPMVDGAQLHVPAEGEAAGVGRGGIVSGHAGPPGSGPAGGSGAGVGGPVDLNRATAAELDALPGIGPALAERIVAHRAANGPFAAPEDLLAVSGIGPKTLARFVDRVAVGR